MLYAWGSRGHDALWRCVLLSRWFYEYVITLFQQVEVEVYIHNLQADVRRSVRPMLASALLRACWLFLEGAGVQDGPGAGERRHGCPSLRVRCANVPPRPSTA